ncbi:10726_t:CDS:2, partial [Acaulospora morrowiae]
QENEGIFQPESSMVPINSVEDDDGYIFEDIPEVELASSLEVEEIDYKNLSNLDSTKPSISTLASKHSPTYSSKSMFTYSNPFDLLKKSPPPSPNRDPVVHHRNSSPPQKKGESSMQKDGGTSYKPEQSLPFLPELSAWNVRANILSRGQPSNNIPDGVRLPRGVILYRTGERNER